MEMQCLWIYLAFILYSDSPCLPTLGMLGLNARTNEGLCHVSHKPSGKGIKWQNPFNKIGKNTQKLRRIIKYSLDIFAYSKDIQIIGRIPTIAL